MNRIRPFLQELISPNQSAFVPGRLITDNALIAFECLFAIQNSSSARTNFCAYKLDLSKAYDRVDWCFLEKAMVKLGFSSTWVRWIMACVSSVRFSVRFNGVPSEPFQPSRGLRQGDPLSPYLFLFVADALSVALKQESARGGLPELRVCRSAPGVSHLLFADDALVFFEAKVEQAERIKEILLRFQAGTGQLLSQAKCSLLTRDTLDTDIQEQIRQVLGVERVDFEAKYLGLPTPDGTLKKDRFMPIKERLTKRVASWSEKFLSSGGKVRDQNWRPEGGEWEPIKNSRN